MAQKQMIKIAITTHMHLIHAKKSCPKMCSLSSQSESLDSLGLLLLPAAAAVDDRVRRAAAAVLPASLLTMEAT